MPTNSVVPQLSARGWALAIWGEAPAAAAASPNWTAPQPIPLLGWVLWLVMMACAVATLRVYKQRLLAVLLVGGVGLMVALTFVFLSAPDLALTQLLVEMVTLVLMLLGMNYLPAQSAARSPVRSTSRAPSRWVPTGAMPAAASCSRWAASSR